MVMTIGFGRQLTAFLPNVIVEYNSLFGPHHPCNTLHSNCEIKVPSQLYYGSSLSSLVQLGLSKGYNLVYANNGNNAFFVRQIVVLIHHLFHFECYRKPQFRESLDTKEIEHF